MSKKCKKCNEIKALNQFIVDNRAIDGHQNKCKQCRSKYLSARYKIDSEKVNIATRAWQNRNRNKIKDTRLRRLYGITLSQREQKLKDQKGSCALCLRHQDELKRSLMVDHCHVTGQVRDLLCFSCNTALGSIKDNIDVARRLVEYIKKHGEANGNSN